MNILIISLWYHPEPVGKPHDLAQEMVNRGHQVTVITGFPNYPSGQVYPGYRSRLFKWETIAGVRVLRIAHLIDRSRSAIRRILSYSSFSLAATLLGSWLLDKPDIIWTYQIGLPGVALAALKRAPLIHEVQDLWPDWGRSATIGLTGLLSQLLIAQEKLVYRWAMLVTTISQGFKRVLVSRGVPAEKIEVIPNWANDRNFRPVARDPELGSREGLHDHFNVIYGGNVGAAQGLGVILEAAKRLRDLPKVQFVIIGDGVERAALEQRAKSEGIGNVRFLGSRPPGRMAPYFAFADVLCIHLVQDPVYEITIPSKTYAYLASGRPILAAAAGDVADLIRETGAGVVCPPEDPAALAEAIRGLLDLPLEQRNAMGQAGRNAFLKSYTRSHLAARYEKLLLASSKRWLS